MNGDEELVPFRFEVTSERIVGTPLETYRRLQRFVTSGKDGFIVFRNDHMRDLVIASGELPQPNVTALQALAMGHDVDAVLDMLESRP